MRVVIEQVGKSFGQTPALREVSLAIEEHELFFLLGPSGCGKTTLLRIVAGFYQPDQGRVTFGARLMNGVPPHQRNTGMVFQNYALWPHMTVAQNVAYGLEVRHVDAAEKKRRVAEALGIVQMEPYAERLPNQLSGGQQQRVALARALVIQPDVLLLDEPLSNLDAKLRLEMREEIRRIHDRTRITTLYVTHDQKESLSLADRLAVMRQGRIEQVGAPREVYRQPATRFVADFMGETNWFEATVDAVTADGVSLRTPWGPWQAQPAPSLKTGQAVCVGFRPESVRLGPSGANTLPATLEQVNYLGEIEQYALKATNGWPFKAFEQNPLEARRPGMQVHAGISVENLLVFPQE